MAKFLPLNTGVTPTWINRVNNMLANLLSNNYGEIPLTEADIKLPGGGGGGATDHGALTGLSDDDHTQYLNNARGDSRYSPLVHTHYLSGQATIAVSGIQVNATVSVPGVLSTNKIIVSLASHDDTDENSEEMLDLHALAGKAATDSITFSGSFEEYTSGNIKVNYMVV